MIFKSLCLQKPLLKSQKCRTFYADRGPSERYAPLGLSFPPLPRRAPFRSRSRGRLRRSDGPCRPAMFGRWIISVTDHVNMALTKTKKCRMILRQITMSLDRQNRAYKTCQKRNSEVVYVVGRKPLVFDPLGNLNSALRINNQKVSRLNESQEVASKWGLGRSVSFHTSM